ncbi:hypothetical protein LKL35_24230 [Streptomyces sp. ET3-23]|uniref:hypothetical protein n=1 Tax=Streptomyces sp. ET3-23 TaxID=2885643 RepID=UPI001D129982|nr:hypothetical protein [Streptomyces sp. ET3-23]MCC2278507.1 hypothetical protein [Streptomyces sp. ET3-23]
MSETNSTRSEVSAETIRAEVRREYAGKLAQAELRAQAARTGAEISDAHVEHLDLSKLVDENGNPSAEVIAAILQPYQKPAEPKFPQLMGAGHYRGGPFPPARRVSLDVRKR